MGKTLPRVATAGGEQKVAAVELIAEVYRHVYDERASFEGAVGRDLAYLLGAMASGGYVVLSPGSTLFRTLKKLPGGESHPVFTHVEKLKDAYFFRR